MATRAGVLHSPCEIELDRAAELCEARGGSGQGWNVAMADMRDLRGRAQVPPVGLGYRQEGILAQVERVPLVMLESGHRHADALELDLRKETRVTASALLKATDGQDGDDRLRAKLVGRLNQFIYHVVESGVLDDVNALDGFLGRHMLQKHAYIAQELGIHIGYKFEFIKNGAYSAAMAVDMYDRGLAAFGQEELAMEPGAREAFVNMVRGRGPEWLQIATFAVRDHGVPGAREAFLSDMYGHLEYDRRLVEAVFAEVGSRMDRLGGRAE